MDLPLSQWINNLLSTSGFQAELREIAYEACEELKQSIWDNFYMAYSPKVYERTYQFLNAVRYEIINTPSNIEIKVFIDPDLMLHPSVVDGMNSYVPPLLYYGHHQTGYDTVDYFHYQPENYTWLNDALLHIYQKVNARVGNAVVKAITTNKYR